VFRSLDASSIEVGEVLGLSGWRFREEIDLRRAMIEGTLDVKNARLVGALRMKGTTVRSDVLFEDVRRRGVFDARGSEIGASLIIARSEFESTVDIGGIRVDESLLIGEGSNSRVTST
jgi:hypothetical protein